MKYSLGWTKEVPVSVPEYKVFSLLDLLKIWWRGECVYKRLAEHNERIYQETEIEGDYNDVTWINGHLLKVIMPIMRAGGSMVNDVYLRNIEPNMQYFFIAEGEDKWATRR